jgi:hypothetical protein
MKSDLWELSLWEHSIVAHRTVPVTLSYYVSQINGLSFQFLFDVSGSNPSSYGSVANDLRSDRILTSQTTNMLQMERQTGSMR